jgi:hypothetical protein
LLVQYFQLGRRVQDLHHGRLIDVANPWDAPFI